MNTLNPSTEDTSTSSAPGTAGTGAADAAVDTAAAGAAKAASSDVATDASDNATATLLLHGPEDTERLGIRLAEALVRGPFAVLLEGDLGCGKTTLVRALARALPGGTEAEVASPSFTLCNFYPTRPPLAHCDLYRSGPGTPLPDEVAEALETGCVLVCEWASFLDPRDAPDGYVQISFDFSPHMSETCRALTLAARGPLASAFVRSLADMG